jgi:PiT family inorganic phosphate transporter
LGSYGQWLDGRAECDCHLHFYARDQTQNAILMAAVFNFLGVFVMTLINKSVAMTISNMVDFGTICEPAPSPKRRLASIVIWATAAWYFGIPTSESHALIAGLTGAAVAYFNSFQG